VKPDEAREARTLAVVQVEEDEVHHSEVAEEVQCVEVLFVGEGVADEECSTDIISQFVLYHRYHVFVPLSCFIQQYI